MAVGNFEFVTTPVTISNANVELKEHQDATSTASGPITPLASNLLLETDQPFDIEFTWDQDAGSFWMAGGNWSFDVWLEEMGPGEGGAHYTGNVAAIPVDGPGYTFVLNVPLAQVPTAGLYRVTVGQQFNSLGSPRALAMFADIGLVRFFDAAP
ncbi:MAG: hypothetical protein J5I94_26650 [Phaeodactylibacter sp.]|nr:hypothetical protein [Phaeodactylibacter sp.]